MHPSDYIYPLSLCSTSRIVGDVATSQTDHKSQATVYHTYLPGGGAVLQGHVALYTHHNVRNICLPERDNYAGNPYSNYIIVTLSNGYRHNIIINQFVCTRHIQDSQQLVQYMQQQHVKAVHANYSWFVCLCLFTMSATTAGSAKVEMSPKSSGRLEAIWRRMRRIIFPERVFGRPDVTYRKESNTQPP